MNDKEMRIAIAECVFEHLKTEKQLVAHQNKTHELLYGGHDSFGLWIWMEPNGKLYGMNYDTLEELERGSINEIAERNNYFRDLNAMREAISILSSAQRKAIRAVVWELTDQMTPLPPASVFAEAFLRTIGKWKLN